MLLSAAIERFSADIAGEFGVAVSLQFDSAMAAIDLEGDGNPDACAFVMAVEWIAGHRDRTVMERIDMIDKLRRLKGRNVITMREFTGWQ
jgi:hypothetical protein